MPDDIELDQEAWFPWWKRPQRLQDWEQLLVQAKIFADSTKESHKTAKAAGMPDWFVKKVARSRFTRHRRLARLRRRVMLEQMKLVRFIEQELGGKFTKRA